MHLLGLYTEKKISFYFCLCNFFPSQSEQLFLLSPLHTIVQEFSGLEVILSVNAAYKNL